MGCLNANIQGKGCLSASVKLVSEGLKVSIGRVGEDLAASVNRIGSNLKVNIGLICTPNTEVYLRVTPDVLWFFQAETLDVEVASNIKWIVK